MGPGSGQRATETRLNPARGCSRAGALTSYRIAPARLPEPGDPRPFRSPGTRDPAGSLLLTRCLALARPWSPAASEVQPLGCSTVVRILRMHTFKMR